MVQEFEGGSTLSHFAENSLWKAMDLSQDRLRNDVLRVSVSDGNICCHVMPVTMVTFLLLYFTLLLFSLTFVIHIFSGV